LSPTAPAARCDCGSIAWRPAGWNANDLVSAIADVLAYVEDAPPYEVAAEQVLLTCLLQPCNTWDESSPPYTPLTFHDIAAALQVLAPKARWATIGERLCAVLPVGVSWDGGRAGRLRQAAGDLRYRLVREHPVNSLPIPCLLAGEDTDRDLPKWFDVSAARGGWQLRIDADAGRLWQRCVDEHPDVDDTELDDVVGEVVDYAVPCGDDGVWAVATPWWEGEGVLAVARRIDDPFDAAALSTALRDGVVAVAALHTTAATQVSAHLRGAE
jgi:hypothetical protein